MWNLSYRWQRRTRLVVGVLALLLSAAGLFLVARTSAAGRAMAGARDVLGETFLPAQQTVDTTVPADLHAQAGTLVYLERADGVAQVVGRVVAAQGQDKGLTALKIRFMAPIAVEAQRGGLLKGAPASLDLRDAMRLLVSPNTPEQEAALARDTIWPSVRESVLPAMTDGLIREIANELASLDEQDQELLAQSINDLRAELRPLEDQLIDRLARRAWDVIGVKGLATGIWRTTASSVETRSNTVSDWWWKLFGTSGSADPASRPFLSEQTSRALEEALKDETVAFWKQHRQTIVAALVKVATERRGDFEAAFTERWARRLYERAVVPAWRDGQEKVLESVQTYANDFTARRLLTRQGGPRLLFAFALRSSLEISDAPLLVYSPAAAAASGKIVYQPLLR
jgi:hypothetical protein